VITILPENAIDNYLLYLNSINNNIQFTVEVENNNWLPFLDLLVTKLPDG